MAIKSHGARRRLNHQMNKPLFLWTDIETSGLDEKTGLLLEVAGVLTDFYLNEIGSVQGVIHYDPNTLAKAIDRDFVWDMHTANGLLNDISQSKKTTSDVEDSMLDLLSKIKDGREIIIAGSNVMFDVLWLDTRMPRLMKKLKQRSGGGLLAYYKLDVSTYYAGFPDEFPKIKLGMAHRAMHDIKASIELHRKMRNIVSFYRDW